MTDRPWFTSQGTVVWSMASGACRRDSEGILSTPSHVELFVTPQWREFELLVARIEQALAPSGAVIRSPDKIADKDTGQLREVDCSIRYTIGTVPILITVECRDRAGDEDVRWIEAIAEKKRSIGAAMTVAVSSSGFTKPALVKASNLGIETRVLTEQTLDDVIGWLKCREVTLDLEEWSLAYLGLEFHDYPAGVELDDAALEAFHKHGAGAAIFVRSDGKRGSLEALLAMWTDMNGSIFPDDLPSDGTEVRRKIYQRIERGTLRVITKHGLADLAALRIGLSFHRSVSQIPLQRLMQYSNPTDALVQTAEWAIHDSVKLSLHRHVPSGQVKFVIGPHEPMNVQ